MEMFVAGYPADGIVRAQEAGIVDRVLIEPGDLVQAGAVCVQTHPADCTLCVKYSLSAEDAQCYQSPDIAKATVKTLIKDGETGNASLSTETLNMSVLSCAYSDKTDRFEVVSTVSAPEGSPILGTGVKIDISAGVYESYESVVPAYCVRSDESGEFVFIILQRDSLFGVEDYVLRRDVTVTARNGMYAALSFYPGQQVVGTATLPVSTGDVVVVRQP
jgi:hypothetical protein